MNGIDLKERNVPMRSYYYYYYWILEVVEGPVLLRTMLSDCLSKGESTSNSQSNKLKSEGGCDAVVQAAGSQELNVSGIEVLKRG